MTQSKSGGYLAWLSMHGHQAELQVMVIKPKKCTMSTRVPMKWYCSKYCSEYRVFSLTWPASMQIYWNKRKCLHKKRGQLPEDWFGTPTWPPFHCFGTPIWPSWRHVKTLYMAVISLPVNLPLLIWLCIARCHDLLWLRN